MHRTRTRSRSLLLVLAALLAMPAGSAHAFSSTSGQCSASTFLAVHGVAQPGNGGFTLTSSSPDYAPGEVLQITLDAAAPTAFKGVLLYAFDSAGDRRGTFALSPGYQEMAGPCPGDPVSTITQTDSGLKSTPVTFDWTAPDAAGPLTFVANVVVDMTAFYLLDPIDIVSSATGVSADAVTRMAVLEAAPNPFTDGTTIRFAAPRNAAVSLRVFDVTGRAVRALEEGAPAAGDRSVRWDGRSDDGARVRPGVYLVRMESAGVARTTKVLRAATGS